MEIYAKKRIILLNYAGLANLTKLISDKLNYIFNDSSSKKWYSLFFSQYTLLFLYVRYFRLNYPIWWWEIKKEWEILCTLVICTIPFFLQQLFQTIQRRVTKSKCFTGEKNYGILGISGPFYFPSCRIDKVATYRMQWCIKNYNKKKLEAKTNCWPFIQLF